jgi:ABC-type dipeptide/oligopeptide/nickel transport system ATPase subunit
MNEINGVSGCGRMTMKESTKEDWDDESENMSREKCKEQRERETERAATRNSIHVFQEEKLNYILPLRTIDGIITESVRKNAGPLLGTSQPMSSSRRASPPPSSPGPTSDHVTHLSTYSCSGSFIVLMAQKLCSKVVPVRIIRT